LAPMVNTCGYPRQNRLIAKGLLQLAND